MRLRYFGGIVTLVMLALLGQGCATMIHGSRQEVMIYSDPPGAVMSIEGFSARTPAKVSLARVRDYVVTIEDEEYGRGQAMITRSFNGWSTILGNILWLLPGVVLDLGTGGAWTLEPQNVNVRLGEYARATRAAW
ncbi:MAG: hypothetical protein C3F08_02690 [Candidatus Methylomirabilota bacterium]|nr:MAG: hypothetical protein C3F08_02690 [candidate division NC10 bacterium]